MIKVRPIRRDRKSREGAQFIEFVMNKIADEQAAQIEDAVADAVIQREIYGVVLGKPFLLQLSVEMEEQIEAKRIEWGLKSRAETVRRILTKGLI